MPKGYPRNGKMWQVANAEAIAVALIDIPRMDSNESARFWAKVIPEPNSGCWLWTGAVTRNGPKQCYGMFRNGFDKQMWRASKYIYEMVHGPVSPGLVMRHKCDNSLCVNPNHLETGTHKDNARDRESRGRGVHIKGEDHWNVKLNVQNVIIIKQMLREGVSVKIIADSFNVAPGAISAIKYGYTWRHVVLT